MIDFRKFEQQKLGLNIERKIDGYYTITSNEVPGLLLSGTDLTELLSDVELVITKLNGLNAKDVCPYCRLLVVNPESYLEDHDECLPC